MFFIIEENINNYKGSYNKNDEIMNDIRKNILIEENQILMSLREVQNTFDTLFKFTFYKN